MEKLEYKIVIAAPAKQVWEMMLGEKTYKQWTERAWPGSTFEGKWAEGERMKFMGPDGSGTLAEVAEAKPHERVFARHIAVLQKGGVEDRTSDVAKDWIGTTEAYDLSERDGETTLTVTIEAPPQWVEMFNEGWPIALEDLKRITEEVSHPV